MSRKAAVFNNPVLAGYMEKSLIVLHEGVMMHTSDSKHLYMFLKKEKPLARVMQASGQ
jgi:hypothetical protein